MKIRWNLTGWKKKQPAYLTENVEEDLIRLENLVKIYDTGAIKVLGLSIAHFRLRRKYFVKK